MNQAPPPPDIGSVLIDPTSETSARQPSDGLALREAKSYDLEKLRYDLEHAKHNSGVAGRFFGSGQSAAANIAGIVVIACLLLIFGLTFFSTNPSAGDHIKNTTSVMLAALGYLFGATTKK